MTKAHNTKPVQKITHDSKGRPLSPLQSKIVTSMTQSLRDTNYGYQEPKGKVPMLKKK